MAYFHARVMSLPPAAGAAGGAARHTGVRVPLHGGPVELSVVCAARWGAASFRLRAASCFSEPVHRRHSAAFVPRTSRPARYVKMEGRQLSADFFLQGKKFFLGGGVNLPFDHFVYICINGSS